MSATSPPAASGTLPPPAGSHTPPVSQFPKNGLPPVFPNQGPNHSPTSPSPFGSPPSTSGNTSQLDATSARKIVEDWLAIKQTVFSSPYDVSRLDQFIVDPGPLYSDITRAGGSVDSLRSNNSSYYYKDLKILGVSDFRHFPDRAHLTVNVLEDLELRTPQGIDRAKSGRKTQSWIYELKMHNGRWLVYDYRKDI